MSFYLRFSLRILALLLMLVATALYGHLAWIDHPEMTFQLLWGSFPAYCGTLAAVWLSGWLLFSLTNPK